MRIELADRLAQGGVGGGDGGLAAVRSLLRARQDRAVEGEMFSSHGLGQDTGIVFDQVKLEIVLPQIDALTSHKAEVPVTADGCQTMKSDWLASPADLK